MVGHVHGFRGYTLSLWCSRLPFPDLQYRAVMVESTTIEAMKTLTLVVVFLARFTFSWVCTSG